MAQSNNYRKALATNSTSSSYASKVPTITEPATNSDNGIYDVRVAETLEILPYGIGANNDTFNMRVIGWRQIGPQATALWIPEILADLAVTLSNSVGVAGATIIATERFADAITVTSGNPAAVVGTTTAETPLKATISVAGYNKIEFDFDITGTTTSMNALFVLY
jgi:hypothetical protein